VGIIEKIRSKNIFETIKLTYLQKFQIWIISYPRFGTEKIISKRPCLACYEKKKKRGKNQPTLMETSLDQQI
jgi:hypothetical protein